MLKIALVALALLLSCAPPAYAQETKQEAIALPPGLGKLLVANWYKIYQEKVNLLRQMHEPGQRVTWLQETVYLSIMEAAINQGLDLEKLGTSDEELLVLTFGGD